MDINISVLINSKEIAAQSVFSVHVNKQVNKVTGSVIRLIDGNASKEDFKLSDSADFIPGTPVTIKAGYDSTQSVIFSGFVVQQNLQASAEGGMLILHCKDESFKMTIGRKNNVYEDATDSSIIEQVISAYGISKSVDSTSYQNKEIIQWYSSDWDFLVTRADVNGMVVLTDQGKIIVQKPDTSQTEVATLTYGYNIYNIDITADAKTQYSSVQASSWDIKTQKIISANAKDPSVTLPGNLSPSQSASFADKDPFILQTTSNLEQAEIQNWADACLLKSRLSFISGEMKIQGDETILPGKMIALKGMGERFNGKAFVWEVNHNIEDGNWFTEVTLGASQNWYSEETPDIETPPASGLLPGVTGLQNAVVKQIDSDPLKEFRVQVTLPLLNNKTVWARLASLYSTSNAGTYFFPEIGDEVILGFFNDDPRFPVILGSLYSSSKQPPYTPDAKNNTKAIVSKNAVKIVFDDEKKSLTLITPQNNSIILSDDNKSIVLSDQHGNKIEMNSLGINIQSASDIVLKANQNITMEATSNISIKATNELDMKGLNINGTADAQMVMKGTASGEFSASGEVTIKGAMVMIN